MKIAECDCKECGVSFKVQFNGDTEIPSYKCLICPVCGVSDCLVTWIDK